MNNRTQSSPWVVWLLALSMFSGTAMAQQSDLQVQATTLLQEGQKLYEAYQFHAALEKLQVALSLYREIFDRQGEAATLSIIGTLYSDLGKNQEALQYFEQALAIARDIGDRAAEGTILNNIGMTHRSLGQYQEALQALQQVLAIRRETSDRQGEAITLNNIAFVYQSLGSYKQALEYYDQALTIERDIQDRRSEAMTLDNIGATHTLLAQYQEALQAFHQALAIRREIGDRRDELITLNNIGYVHRVRKDLSQAIIFYKEAVDRADSILGDIKVEEIASAFTGQVVGVYASLIQLLAQTGDPVSAFNYAERARARAFLNLIGNNPIDFRRGAPDELLKKEYELRRKIIELKNALAGRTALSDQRPRSLTTLTDQLNAAYKEHEEVMIQIKIQNPGYASMVSVNPLTLDEVQSQVLDPDSTLIEYFVTDEGTLAWVIDRQSFHLVTLASTRSDLEQKIDVLNSLIRDYRSEDAQLAASLYESLFAPLIPYIQHRNLVIVPHDVLHYLPFAALWNPESKRYLFQDYALSFAPSASVLKFAVERRNPEGGRFLILGNPDGTLPYAEAEAKAIAQLFGTRPLLGPEATEGQVHDKAGQIDLLHLAVHGEYNKANPLFTHLKLRADDQQKDGPYNPQKDGDLQVLEVFNLDLKEANLVVLSACETALGPRTAGDEIVGLIRAFLYAGTPALVTTLWGIDDEATKVLMEAFYRRLREGKIIAVALREAQWEVMRQERWRNPYYWASFVLTGDYRGNGALEEIRVLELSAGETNPLLLAVVGVLGLLVLATGGFLLWCRLMRGSSHW